MKGDRKNRCIGTGLTSARALALSAIIAAGFGLSDTPFASAHVDVPFAANRGPAKTQAETKIAAPASIFRNRIGDKLSYQGYLDFEYEHKHNFDVDDSSRNNLGTIAPVVQINWGYRHNNIFDTVIGFEISRDYDLIDQADTNRNQNKISLQKLYVQATAEKNDAWLRFGRQRIFDYREWLFDEALDGLRINFDLSSVQFDSFFVREEIARKNLLDPKKTDAVNYIYLSAARKLPYGIEISAYLLYAEALRKDETKIYYGLRARGELSWGLDFWLDTAILRGDDVDNDLAAHAFDLGANYNIGGPWKPYVFGGFAAASGDADRADNRTETFRQTGLEDNQGNFGGVTNYKYYGELFDPELANIKITTFGLGFYPAPKTSIDLVFHTYWQDQLRNRDRADITTRPNGINSGLGQEIDLVLSSKFFDSIRLRGKLGYFSPGEAYGNGADPAYFGKFEIRYYF